MQDLEIWVKEEVSRNAVYDRRKSNSIMTIVLTLGRKVIRIICACGSQSERPDTEKVCFYDKVASGRELESSNEIIISMENFIGHVGKRGHHSPPTNSTW